MFTQYKVLLFIYLSLNEWIIRIIHFHEEGMSHDCQQDMFDMFIQVTAIENTRFLCKLNREQSQFSLIERHEIVSA